MELLTTITKILCEEVLFGSRWGCLSPKICNCLPSYRAHLTLLKTLYIDRPSLGKKVRLRPGQRGDFHFSSINLIFLFLILTKYNSNEFTILMFFSVQLSRVKHIHIIVQPISKILFILKS